MWLVLSLAVLSGTYAFVANEEISRLKLSILMSCSSIASVASALCLRMAQTTFYSEVVDEPFGELVPPFWGLFAGLLFCVWIASLNYCRVLLRGRL